MNIIDDIKKLEKLARIRLTEEERLKFAPMLEQFRNEIEEFKKLDLSNVGEARAAFLLSDNLDKDVDALRSDEIISNNNDNFLNESKNSNEKYIVLKEGK